MKLPTRTFLNLGSGKDRRPDAVNVDVTSDTDPDVVHDLNVFPWPFPDNSFEHVLAQDVLEHLDDRLAAMREIHRVCAHGAVVHILVPHFSSANAFTDPTHRGFFGRFSMDYLTGESVHSYYARERYELLNAEIVFKNTQTNKIIRRLANRYPMGYEQRWAWMFPAWFLSFRLRVVKTPSSA